MKIHATHILLAISQMTGLFPQWINFLWIGWSLNQNLNPMTIFNSLQDTACGSLWPRPTEQRQAPLAPEAWHVDIVLHSPIIILTSSLSQYHKIIISLIISFEIIMKDPIFNPIFESQTFQFKQLLDDVCPRLCPSSRCKRIISLDACCHFLKKCWVSHGNEIVQHCSGVNVRHGHVQHKCESRQMQGTEALLNR